MLQWNNKCGYGLNFVHVWGLPRRAAAPSAAALQYNGFSVAEQYLQLLSSIGSDPPQAQLESCQMAISACSQTMIREASYFSQRSCSQNDEFLAFLSKSGSGHFGTAWMYPNFTYQLAYHPVGHLMSTPGSLSDMYSGELQ